MKKIIKIWPFLLIAFIAFLFKTTWQNIIFESKNKFSNSIEARDIIITPKVSGRIKKIYVLEGHFIKKGEKILSIEGNDYKAQLEQVNSSLEKTKFDLLDLKAGYRNQEIQSQVALTKKTQAQVCQAKAKLENANSEYIRMKTLYNQGGISAERFDQYKTQKIVSEKDVRALEQELIRSKENESLLKEGARKLEIKSLESQVKYYEAKKKECDDYINELEIKSPIDGIISSFDMREGEIVKAFEPILTITNLNDIYVRIYIPSITLPKIMLGEEITINADGIRGESFSGTITYIGEKAEFIPRNIQTSEERSKLVYPIKIQIENKENKLKKGMYVTVTL